MVGKISCESKVLAGTVVRAYKVGAENVKRPSLFSEYILHSFTEEMPCHT